MILVGRIIGPHGVKGEIRAELHTDNPHRFSPGSQVWIEGRCLRVERCRRRKGQALIKFSGIDTKEDAQPLRGVSLEVPLEEVPPPPPEHYYHFQIVDIEVWTEEGEYLGKVTEILNTGSNDVYVIHQGEQELLVPALKDVITSVDTGQGRMTVHLPEGLR